VIAESIRAQANPARSVADGGSWPAVGGRQCDLSQITAIACDYGRGRFDALDLTDQHLDDRDLIRAPERDWRIVWRVRSTAASGK